jgi:hypothetical protein
VELSRLNEHDVIAWAEVLTHFFLDPLRDATPLFHVERIAGPPSVPGLQPLAKGWKPVQRRERREHAGIHCPRGWNPCHESNNPSAIAQPLDNR